MLHRYIMYVIKKAVTGVKHTKNQTVSNLFHAKHGNYYEKLLYQQHFLLLRCVKAFCAAPEFDIESKSRSAA